MLAGGQADNQNDPLENRKLIEQLAAAPTQQQFIEAPASTEKAREIIAEFKKRLNKGGTKRPPE
jgi:hypothetical protein